MIPDPAKHRHHSFQFSLFFFVSLLLALVAPHLTTAQSPTTSAPANDPDITCRPQFKTSNNCYRLLLPANAPNNNAPAKALVVLLPYFGSDANEFSSAALPQLLAAQGVATMSVSAAGYLADKDLLTLKSLVTEVATQLKISPGHLAIGGVSAGGTGAVRFTEYCLAGHCDPAITPVAVFSVDAPLDFQNWWIREKLNLTRANPKSGLDESKAVLEGLRSSLGGSPDQVPNSYRAHSPFLVTEKDGGNARYLKNIPIRLYTEPDVTWNIDNIGRDYYTMNALDQAALILQLHALGNTRAELITTTGKGFRPPGTRNPHSWSIVDEPALCSWLLSNLRLP